MVAIGKESARLVAFAGVNPGKARGIKEDVRRSSVVEKGFERMRRLGGVEMDQSGVGDGRVRADRLVTSLDERSQQMAADLSRAADDEGAHLSG